MAIYTTKTELHKEYKHNKHTDSSHRKQGARKRDTESNLNLV
jgi:hypothetical protein